MKFFIFLNSGLQNFREFSEIKRTKEILSFFSSPQETLAHAKLEDISKLLDERYSI